LGIHISNLADSEEQISLEDHGFRPKKEHFVLLFLSFFIILVVSLYGGNSFTAYSQSLRTEIETRRQEAQNNAQKTLLTALSSTYQTAQTAGRHADFVVKSAAEHAAAWPKAEDQTGIYLTTVGITSSDFLDPAVENIGKLQNPAIVFDVKGTFVYFPSGAKKAQEYGLVRPLYDLPEMVAQLKEEGFYVIARYISVKDPEFAKTIPDVQIKNFKTGIGLGDGWVDPSHGVVLEYNKEIIKEIALSGVDEINLDYIRYPTDYSQYLMGLSREEKTDNLEKFIVMARKVIDETNPGVRLGISTYAILGWHFDENVERIGQDVVRFAPYLDIISPMAYPATFSVGGYYNPDKDPGSRMYYLVYRTIEGYEELLGPEHAHKIRPWIQGYFTNTKNMVDQMNAVYDSGHCGFTVWSAGGNYDSTYKALRKVEVPEECK
jgi:hypothetical protein